MPTYSPPFEPRFETVFEHCEGEDAILPPQQIVSFHIKMVRHVYWNESYTMFVSQIQNVAG